MNKPLLPYSRQSINIKDIKSVEKVLRSDLITTGPVLKLFEKSAKLEDDFAGRNTNPSKVFTDRCNYFKENPPELDWNGVWKMATK